jgi:hypothetical protein
MKIEIDETEWTYVMDLIRKQQEKIDDLYNELHRVKSCIPVDQRCF